MIFKLVLFAVVTCLIIIVLRESFKPGAVILAVCGCVSLFLAFARIFASIKDIVGGFDTVSGVDTDGISIIFKTLMVAYITSLGSDICTDAGQKAIANALETAGKAIMLSMALPMLIGIFESVRDIIGG